MRVAALVPDLLFGSRVKATLEQAGHEVTLVAAPGDLGTADVIVADLTAVAPEDVPTGGAPVLGFYAHVEPQVRERALAAGFALAVPRSRFAREGADLLTKIASPSDP